MQYSKSIEYVVDFVEKVKRKRFKKSSSGMVQKIPVDEQTKNNFELTHNTTLKDPMIYLEADDDIYRTNHILAYVLANEIHIKKSKYNPGSAETAQILEHELTHVQQYSENRDSESADELELEANLNETRHVRNGEEVHRVEYISGKYCKMTKTEYKKMLNRFAQDFEDKVTQKVLCMRDDEKKLKFLVNLQEWAKEY